MVILFSIGKSFNELSFPVFLSHMIIVVALALKIATKALGTILEVYALRGGRSTVQWSFTAFRSTSIFYLNVQLYQL